MANAPIEYVEFNFPPDVLLSEILYNVHFVDMMGRQRTRTERVLARGRFRLPKNTAISLNLKYDATSNMQFIEKLKVCRVVNVDASKLDFGDAELAHIKDFKDLVSLDLFDCLISDKSLETIGKMSKLDTLNISHTSVRGEGFKHLNNLKKLTQLFVSTLSLKKGSLAQLRPLAPQLVRLNCGHCGFKDEDIAIIQDMPALKTLDISCNSAVDNDAVKFLARLNHLTNLNIEDTKIDEKSLPALVKLRKLEKVYVRERFFWHPGSQKFKGKRPQIIDIASTSDYTPDMLQPLH